MNAILTRRRMLAATASATGCIISKSAQAAPQADASAPDLQQHPWIDAHSHIWTHDVEKYPLANNYTVDNLKPQFTERELLEVAHRSGVGRVVLIHHHPFYGWDNSFLVETALQYPQTFRVVGTVDNLKPQSGAQMRALHRKQVTGIRVTSSLHKEKWLDEGMDEMWRTAADTGQQMCCLINPDEIPQIDAMCGKHESTPVVIDHFARIGVDGEIRENDVATLCRLARHQHTAVKLSAYYALGQKKPPYLDLAPMIRRLLDAFGPERLMWASDSPYQLGGKHSYEASLALIRDRLDFLSPGDRAQLLAKTAERIFFST